MSGDCYNCWEGFVSSEDGKKCVEPSELQTSSASQAVTTNTMDDINCADRQIKVFSGGMWVCEQCPDYQKSDMQM
jgi:hypothetical protein